jgi:8-oxo-dGTP pyrophosphatase MutT (NUDIX family)
MKKSIRAGAIVVNKDLEIALCNEHLWGFPRGGVEEGEDYITTAKREVLEEIGLSEFSHIKELGVYKRYPHGIDESTPGSYPMEIHMFLFKVDSKPKLISEDKKIGGTGWFTYTEALEKLTNETDKSFLIKQKNVIYKNRQHTL